MRAVILTIVFLIGSIPAAGQALDLDHTVKELLGAPSHEVKAWGAYMAAKHGLTGSIPDLWNQVILLKEDKSKTPNYLRYALLDALIRLKAEPDPEGFAALPRRFNTHKFLLLINNPDHNQEKLMDLLRHGAPSRTTIIAISNLLAPKKTGGLVYFLLGKLNLELRIDATDQNRFTYFSGRSSSHGDGFFYVPKGFPPVTLYHLREGGLTHRKKGYRLISPGKHPVYCGRRLVQPGDTAGFGSVGPPKITNKEVLEYLTLMGEKTIEFKAYRNRSVVWKDPESFLKGVRLHQEKMQKELDVLKKNLMSSNLLTQEEFDAFQPKITITVADNRKDKTVPLPEIK